MEAERRKQIAEVGRALLPDLRQAVVDAWAELLPMSAEWRPEARERARQASDIAVAALVEHIAIGDLDDRTWLRVQQAIAPHGATIASELLRAVSIVAVEQLTEALALGPGVVTEERWELFQEASTFTARLVDRPEELGAAGEQALLAELAASGPDLAPAPTGVFDARFDPAGH